MPARAVLARRSSLRSNRPSPEQSLSESTAFAIRQTEGQLRRMKQSRWYPLFHLIGIYLSLEPLWLSHGTIQPIGRVLLSIFAALWILGLMVNRWMIRRLLRPRLAELEELRAGFHPRSS